MSKFWIPLKILEAFDLNDYWTTKNWGISQAVSSWKKKLPLVPFLFWLADVSAKPALASGVTFCVRTELSILVVWFANPRPNHWNLHDCSQHLTIPSLPTPGPVCHLWKPPKPSCFSGVLENLYQPSADHRYIYFFFLLPSAFISFFLRTIRFNPHSVILRLSPKRISYSCHGLS